MADTKDNNTPYETACSNCSCKCGIKRLLSPEMRWETLELYKERKETWETFQCYMRWWKQCKIAVDCFKYIDKNPIVLTELEYSYVFWSPPPTATSEHIKKFIY